MTPLFVSQPPQAFALGFMKHFGMQRDRSRALVHRRRARHFPHNIDIRFYQTWVADRDALMRGVDEGEESVTRPSGFVFDTNLYLLPEKPMRPRFWDPRVGYFATSFQDYGTRRLRRHLARLHPALSPGEEGPEGAAVRPGPADRVLHRPRGAGGVAARTSSRPSKTGRACSRKRAFTRDRRTPCAHRGGGPVLGPGRRALQRDPLDAQRTA